MEKLYNTQAYEELVKSLKLVKSLHCIINFIYATNL